MHTSERKGVSPVNLTSQDVLGKWLIKVLGDHGGRAEKARALDWIEQEFGHLLTPDDWLAQPSNGETKWRNQTAWERNKLVESGILLGVSESGRGVWALSEHGFAQYRRLPT
jgi:Mrr N-terminal domain